MFVSTARMCLAIALAAGVPGFAVPASAETLRIGLSAEPTSVDPHFHNYAANNALAKHIFSALVEQDAQQRLQPGLAESWEAIDETTWRFRLRQDATFSNGEPFTARDVVYTVCRIPTVPNSPSPFTLYTGAIADIEASDDHTLIIRTDEPAPLLPTHMSTFTVLSASVHGADDTIRFDREGCEGIGEPPASEAFSSPDVAVGTGPYKLVSFTRGDRIVLERRDDYWGEPAEWDQIVLRPITNPGARVAALLAGDVDLIENPPTQDIDRIEGAGFTVRSGLSNRVIYIALDQGEAPSPGISGTDDNPLQDVRVREALAKAINREAIKDRIMLGLAEPAGELLPPPMFGSNPDRPAVPYDEAAARQLLEEAGFGDGFEITLGTPNDRYINDHQIAQAVAGMWSRIGVRTDVDAKTFSAFISDRNAHTFSAFLAGWGAGTGEMSSPLAALVATRDPDRGLGGTNYARHSNPEMDELLVKALRTVDEAEREALLQEASRKLMENYGIIPIHYEMTTWASRADLEYEPRADQATLGYLVRLRVS